ncbi:uncharacterized protein LOC123699117 [Colias croceus]|uniref:uncharacterized protein LOC123699117 n=1 Tax=Colias crocea TaxID=72248 RepID=UPI001E27F5D9|nr:uncharacterized protein LOC123699117 [Colias croceus]CAG4946932.1 unnamed protein product [Colias eurytheme]
MALNPKKFLTKDLINKPAPLDVWLQGTIEQTVGNDILIISDTFGRAKIVKCESADGVINKNSLRKGVYCCIIGVAVKTKGLPEIQATKFVDLSAYPQMKASWENEVKETELLMQGKIKPIL